MEKGMDINEFRRFLKDTIRMEVDFSATCQNLGLEPPPVEKPRPPDAEVIPLPKPRECLGLYDLTLGEAIKRRRSERSYSPDPITLSDLSFMLWACQGVRGREVNGHAFRTVPSAGCRHALETYPAVLNVEGLRPGIYRFLPLTHSLLPLEACDDLSSALSEAALGQSFVAKAAVTFIWTAVPYRMEWRYGEAAHKVIALDAGHACQNLYLAAVAAGSGVCAIAAYDQGKSDLLVNADGTDEFVIYMAAAGKRRKRGRE